MELIKLFDEYIEEAKILTTKGTYRYNKSCLNYIQKCFEGLNLSYINQITSMKYIEVIKWFKENTLLKNNSINKMTSFLNIVFKRNGYSLRDDFKKLKPDTTNYKAFSNNEKNKILECLNGIPEFGNNLFYKLAVNILFDTGCRLTELLEIKVKNVIFLENTIFLDHTKSGKKRYVFFKKETRRLLKQVLSMYELDYLFQNILRNRRMNETDLKVFFNKKLSILSSIGSIHAHRFRKTFAVDLYLRNIDLYTIMNLLGHTDLKITQLYLEAPMEYLRKQYFNS